MSKAACRGADSAPFFSVEYFEQSRAQAVCARCPVRQPCLDYALANSELEGIWGGVTQSGRVKNRRRDKQRRAS
jgi:WhiB family transcriptional regulator, redox-sensing transcriptional regulator